MMKHALRSAFVVSILAIGLSGCIRPLYGTAENNGLDIQQSLSNVSITVDGDRMQHYLRNELEFGLRGGNAPSSTGTQYRLTVNARQRVAATVIDRISGAAETATMILEATYTLTETGKPAVLETGTSTVVVSYDRSQQRFASVRAARDAEIQGARQMADQIKTRVAAYLASKR
ncbi:MAG: LPS assembly lipoprotein LptE [Beijerinckiaceae bacterium]